MSSNEGFDAMRSQVEAALMELENTVQPVYAAADRVKHDFIAMGWSAENAEKAAVQWLAGVLGGGAR